ncbi:hypothetical protein KFL_000170450 [Klebsormidium nitens]|uniref:CYTH domain-containing protein n=1 Tax=Klebsormidium nitens TaxID=105231 RepID=A0A1Y1HNE4_KLENI|nr:hypothetical protein KFL_000170450 [Klebsormidium nitens]|eukprot:GAQ78699.1 hypothetical protein KFL_000170450 [Klebsormidium nitens]
MEVEVKLRLPSAEAHAKIAKLLEPNHEVTHLQENVFFDGANEELSANRAILRFRFFNGDDKCIITVKKKTILTDGVGRSEELEEEIEPALARACVVEPSKVLTAGSPLLNQMVSEYKCTGFKCLGGFKNVRHVYHWNDHKIELDETQYDHGTVYELECESTEPDRLKALLEEFLSAHGIAYAYSTSTKFANFKNRTLI